jgi:hypothetical protein
MRFLLLSITLLLTACTGTGKYIEGQAYKRCQDLSGDAQARCLDQERDRLVAELAERDAEILDEVQAQEERAAMRRGQQAPRPSAAAGAEAPGDRQP